MNLSKLRGVLAEKRITQRELAEKMELSVKSVNENSMVKYQLQ